MWLMGTFRNSTFSAHGLPILAPLGCAGLFAEGIFDVPVFALQEVR